MNTSSDVLTEYNFMGGIVMAHLVFMLAGFTLRAGTAMLEGNNQVTQFQSSTEPAHMTPSNSDGRASGVSLFTKGENFFFGIGTTQDFSAALDAFREAGKLGNQDAQYCAGLILWHALGVSKNPSEAIMWLDKASSVGMAPAQYELAWAFIYGYGTNRQPAGGVNLLMRAAEAGESRAQKDLGVMFAIGGMGIKPNDNQACLWLERALKQGDPSAGEVLALVRRSMTPREVTMYEPNSAALDPSYAFDNAGLLRQMAVQNSAGGGPITAGQYLALNPTTRLYYRPVRTTVYPEVKIPSCYRTPGEWETQMKNAYESRGVLSWLRKQAANDYPSAQFSLGMRYYSGDGIPKDETAALMWIRKAATQGHSGAMKFLNSLKTSEAPIRLERGE